MYSEVPKHEQRDRAPVTRWSVNRHFPKGSRLSKSFNSDKVKISYSCIPNMNDIVKAHNKKVLAGVEMNRSRSCNRRRKDQCPLEGNFQAKSIVYRATVNNDEGTKHYDYWPYRKHV